MKRGIWALGIVLFLFLSSFGCNFTSQTAVKVKTEPVENSVIKEKEKTPSSGIEFDMYLLQSLNLGQSGIITITVTSIADLKNAEIKISLPEGFQLLEGDLLWNGDLIVSQEEKDKHPLPPTDCSGSDCERMWQEYKYPSAKITYNITIKAVKEGNWTIEGVFNNKIQDHIYISVTKNQSIIYDTPFP